MRRTLVSKLIVLLVALLSMSLLAACEDFQIPGDRAEAAEPQKTAQAPKKSFCPKAGPITRSQLPSPADAERIATNPCVNVNGLVGLAVQNIPDSAVKTTFRAGIKSFAGKFLLAADAVNCAYENDHLAVAVYRDPEYTWSTGLVAVVRGDVQALAEDAICLLEKQLNPFDDFGAIAEDKPSPRFCADHESRTAQGYDFKILWIANSTTMCRNLAYSIRSA
ncbi:hypothetical protein [Nonomuraea soli]|uniref:DUF3558 domain-containing protein n=1 Tax=Nonomuraea soli TaxID=1032476 RepID=A0A7W0CRE3_9ACTN|nr:hypothetical protein [Nonomuraea soli]MBA2895790.1 hypothetical protein [Nonomuraea soli]